MQYQSMNNADNQTDETYAPPEKSSSENIVYFIGNDIHETLISVRDSLDKYNARGKNPRVFIRDDKLVMVVKDDEGNFFIKELNRGTLSLVLTDTGRWGRYNNKHEPISCKIPRDDLDAIISAGYEWLKDCVPVLRGLHTGVLLDSNNELVHKSGYNPKTKLYLTKDYQVQKIPDNPTEEDIADIRRMFWDIYNEFRFADHSGKDSVDYQNTLAALFTAITRPTWKGTLPIWTVNKSSPRTGGTLLQQVTGLLAYGQIQPSETFPKTENELDKQIKTIIKNRGRYGLIDNVPPGFNWVTNTLLSATGGGGLELEFRDLGSLDTVKRNIETFFAVNGVNLSISADVCGRVLPTKIVSEKSWQKESWNRTKEELITLAAERHPDVVWAAAVLRRYWELHGKPKPKKCEGNISEYTKWYNEICGPLYLAGYRNVLSNLEDVQTTDNSADTEDADFLNALVKKFGQDEFSPTKLTEIILAEGGRRRRGETEGAQEIFLPLLDEYYVNKAVNQTLNELSTGRLLSNYRDKTVSECQYRLRKGKSSKSKIYFMEPILIQEKII